MNGFSLIHKLYALLAHYDDLLAKKKSFLRMSVKSSVRFCGFSARACQLDYEHV